MRKSQLFELIAAIKTLAPEETPIIVGSQAVHLLTDFPPEIVRHSIECDFLIIGGKSETRAEINKNSAYSANTKSNTASTPTHPDWRPLFCLSVGRKDYKN